MAAQDHSCRFNSAERTAFDCMYLLHSLLLPTFVRTDSLYLLWSCRLLPPLQASAYARCSGQWVWMEERVQCLST